MDSKQHVSDFDNFTAASNRLRFASGAHRIELACAHLGDAQKQLQKAFYHAVGAGDFERADAIGTQIIALNSLMTGVIALGNVGGASQ